MLSAVFQLQIQRFLCTVKKSKSRFLVEKSVIFAQIEFQSALRVGFGHTFFPGVQNFLEFWKIFEFLSSKAFFSCFSSSEVQYVVFQPIWRKCQKTSFLVTFDKNTATPAKKWSLLFLKPQRGELNLSNKMLKVKIGGLYVAVRWLKVGPNWRIWANPGGP